MSPCHKMAYSAEADEDFKLPLRPWLEKQINSGKFTGLEWEPCPGKSKEFRLPWVKKNSPNWEIYYKIFRAWAEHRGRGEAEKLDDSKLKSNFRCALNKSVDFEEVVAKSQLHRQTGNYKVYRILTPREVRDKKKKRSKVLIKQEGVANSDEFSTIDSKSLGGLDSLTALSPSSNMGEISLGDLHQPITVFPTIDSDAQSSTYVWTEGDIEHAEVTLSPGETSTSSFVVFSGQCNVNQNNWAEDVSMEQDCTETIAISKEKNVVGDTGRSLILEQLENGGIKREQLRECEVIVTYDGDKVIDMDGIRMDEGCRIFHGDKDEQIHLLAKSNAISEDDLKLPSIQLPSANQKHSTMSAILDKTKLGLIILYDPQTLQFYVKRLCSSQVFFYDPHDYCTDVNPIKLERDQTVPLFSHEKYFMEYMQQYLNTRNDTPPEAHIVLTVGAKPKSKQDLQTMKGLKIELVPHALKLWTPDPLEAPTFRGLESAAKT